ncbi:MAG: CDP-diacylglycerol--serine O-phosphatidyltransferase [Candidatus Methanofastidiosia archaeon]
MSYDMKDYLKKADLFTFANLSLGFLALTFIFDKNFDRACRMILLALVADGFDGYLARRTKTDSEFGMNFDSISDSISFGLAPALILYSYNSTYFMLGVSLVYLSAGVLRLARYNVIAPQMRGEFVGMPIPLAAFLVVLGVFSDFNYMILALMALLSSYLMTCKITFGRKSGERFPVQNLALILYAMIPIVWIEMISRVALAAYVGGMIYTKRRATRG